MIVVADTSPLNYLVRLNKIDLLPNLYGQVLIPQAVIAELLHKDAPSAVKAWAKHPPAWIKQSKPRNINPNISLKLGTGEVEAISLAIEVRADILLVDDYAGREQAQTLGVAVNGTLAILLSAALR